MSIKRYFINNLIDYDEAQSLSNTVDQIDSNDKSSAAKITDNSNLTNEQTANETLQQQQQSMIATAGATSKAVKATSAAGSEKVESIENVNNNNNEKEYPKMNREKIRERIKRLINLIECKQSIKSSADTCDGGPYVGLSGIAYMYWYLSEKKEMFSDEEREAFLITGLKYLKPSLEYAEHVDQSTHERIVKVAYLLGNAGTYLIAVLYYHKLKELNRRDYYLQKFRKLSQTVILDNYLSKGSDELLVGRAGYLNGYIFLMRYLTTTNNSNKQQQQAAGITADERNILSDLNNDEEMIKKLALKTIESGRCYSNKHGYTRNCPLMYSYYDTEYIGAAHGLVGIMQILLEMPSMLNNEETLFDLKKTVDFILSLQTSNGNFPCAMDEIENNYKTFNLITPSATSITKRSEDNELIHWCHGAPGAIWLFAKAYLVWKDEKYLRSCYKAAELIWKRGLLRKGPGVCHGIAGNAYAFLLMYRLTGEKKFLHRANQFHEFMFTKEFSDGSRTPDAPHSLYEGIAGTICFLVDLLIPEKTRFPLYVDIFG